MGKILITGGAGYIGSHIVRLLVEAGEQVIVIDDLSSGHREAVEGSLLFEGDCGDPDLVQKVLLAGDIDVVMHMAAFCEVGESVKDPAAYYANNVCSSLTLLDMARRHRVRGIVFSSTAAVYGEPRRIPIDEDHPRAPTNPYGETKIAFERALQWYHGAYGISSISLRYFNAAGAHPDGDIGEDHSPESHLIPRLLLGVLDEDREPVPIFGEDYPTADGTCVRDYVHVVDIAQAHVLAAQAIRAEEAVVERFNLGNGEGFSVRQVIDAVAEVTGTRPATRPAERRPGDPATLVASSGRIGRRLGWKPGFPELEPIVRTAWDWHRRHPNGYRDRD